MVLLGPLMPKHGHVVRHRGKIGRMVLDFRGEELFKTHGGIFGRLKLGEYGSLDVWKICIYVFSSTILRLVKQYPRYLLKIQHRKMKQDREW